MSFLLIPIARHTSTGAIRSWSVCLALLAALLLGACGKSPAPGTAGTAAATTPNAAADTTATTATQDEPGAGPTPAHHVTGGVAGRNGELTNPDDQTMVFLYYDLAGITPPIDQWVERDNRVTFARGADKAAQRATAKAAFQAGMASVRGVGVIHLTANANLSQYDPTYGEFTVGALAPGSAYTFRALGQQVEVKFDNGLVAQTWSVPKAQAQAIADKIGTDPLTVDATLKIDKVLPRPDGGTIVSRIVSWNLRNARDGTTVARMQVPVIPLERP